MNQHHLIFVHPPLFKQSGAVTLLTSVIILMLATILIISVSRTTIMEQRISSNEIRSRKAFEAAEAGLNFGIAYVTQTTQGGVTVPSGTDKNKNLIADTIALTTITTGTSNQYSVRFCDPTANLSAITCPDSPGPVNCTAAPAKYLRSPRIVACGWSDDGLGRSMVSQNVRTVPALANPPSNPVTAKGAINVGGSASVTNYYNNLTVWSGGSLSNIGNSGKTFVRNPTVSPPAASVPPPDRPTTCSSTADYVCATDKNTTGPDVIDADPTLSNITTAQLFYNYFGVADVAAYQAGIASMPAVAPGNVSTLNGTKQEAFVVSGSINSTMNITIGSRDQPVVMIIDGDWSGGGNTTIYGLVYVRGNIDLSGNKTIYGGVVVEGAVSGTGSLDIIFDQLIMDNLASGNVGKSALVSGSWRDWK